MHMKYIYRKHNFKRRLKETAIEAGKVMLKPVEVLGSIVLSPISLLVSHELANDDSSTAIYYCELEKRLTELEKGGQLDGYNKEIKNEN